jgi:mannose-6-phosphate isomerase-like protein (cupin superfamily)
MGMTILTDISDLDPCGTYTEFLRVHALSAGIYRHAAGAAYPQEPHSEDELYYVIEGEAKIVAGGTDYSVQEGSVVYVPAGMEHHFHSVKADLKVLVIFAPAEGTQGQ